MLQLYRSPRTQPTKSIWESISFQTLGLLNLNHAGSVTAISPAYQHTNQHQPQFIKRKTEAKWANRSRSLGNASQIEYILAQSRSSFTPF